MPLALHVALRRVSGSSVDRRRLANRGRARQLVATGVGAILAVWVALAYASPPDPSWITGIYDDSDFDDVIGLGTDAAGLNDAQVPGLPASVLVSAVLPAVVDMTTDASARDETIRGPPAARRGGSGNLVLIAESRRSSAVSLFPDLPIRNSLRPR